LKYQNYLKRYIQFISLLPNASAGVFSCKIIKWKKQCITGAKLGAKTCGNLEGKLKIL
jgi:hypothetical protein